MLRAFSLSVNQLGDPAIVRVLVLSLAITLALFAGAGVALASLLDGADPCALVDGSCSLNGGVSDLGGVLIAALALWLLFPAVAIAVVSGFVDRIVLAVERRHYPEMAARARPLGVSGAVLLGLRSSARLLLLNLVALPFYIVLLVTGVGTAMLFVAVNGLALGRDLGEMVATRHLDRAGQRRWLRATRGLRFVLGAGASALFLVPVLNLLAPVLAAAMATHLFHDTRGRAETDPTYPRSG